MTPLEALLRQQMQKDGPISVARFMEIALTHPEFGYYMRRDPFGRGGDFITAPEVSQMFGEMIGLWAIHQWSEMGSPKEFALIELGPGRGTLMKDLLRAAKVRPEFLQGVQLHLVEISPFLRQVQQEALKGFEVHHHETLAQALGEIGKVPAIFIANEFFDALPIHQYVKTPEGLSERLIGVNGIGEFSFSEGMTESIRETSPQSINHIRSITDHISSRRGAALIIDYGYLEGEGDTLQAVKGHQYHDMFKNIGEADLTAHVNFGGLKQEAEKSAYSTDLKIPKHGCHSRESGNPSFSWIPAFAGMTGEWDSSRRVGARISTQISTQGDFLEAMGIELRAEKLKSNATPLQQNVIDESLNRLISAQEMGTIFKVLEITRSKQ